jgi:hypothetical protein
MGVSEAGFAKLSFRRTPTPADGGLWNELRRRVADGVKVQQALASLKIGGAIPRELILEGKTHADCLIECEHALIWIEGKRFDWLSPSTTWDVSRIARNSLAGSAFSALISSATTR